MPKAYASPMHTQLYIDGQWVDGVGKLPVYDPSDGSVIAEVALAGDAQCDAAIAAAAALMIVEPVSNGLGSDCFAIVWDGKELHGLNSSGTAPQAWSPEYFSKK